MLQELITFVGSSLITVKISLVIIMIVSTFATSIVFVYFNNIFMKFHKENKPELTKKKVNVWRDTFIYISLLGVFSASMTFIMSDILLKALSFSIALYLLGAIFLMLYIYFMRENEYRRRVTKLEQGTRIPKSRPLVQSLSRK
ncbi:hypothetical protein ABD87_22690 [Lysinibacillus sphaericus]|uniref:hypothetical protein n=1 Tax=Lysinibacillus sphaericus TaxID=1421 RepID=UPI0018CEDA8B|nr:hypothetical protein [Lysinibacillus sphaericus]MBG9732235.1 hypothetical protein [Lysinibacillus sphaericus]